MNTDCEGCGLHWMRSNKAPAPLAMSVSETFEGPQWGTPIIWGGWSIWLGCVLDSSLQGFSRHNRLGGATGADLDLGRDYVFLWDSPGGSWDCLKRLCFSVSRKKSSTKKPQMFGYVKTHNKIQLYLVNLICSKRRKKKTPANWVILGNRWHHCSEKQSNNIITALEESGWATQWRRERQRRIWCSHLWRASLIICTPSHTHTRTSPTLMKCNRRININLQFFCVRFYVLSRRQSSSPPARDKLCLPEELLVKYTVGPQSFASNWGN